MLHKRLLCAIEFLNTTYVLCCALCDHNILWFAVDMAFVLC